MRIAVDAMGGDNAPKANVKGAIKAASEEGINIILTGDKEKINALLKEYNYSGDKIKVVETTEIITNYDKPTTAIRLKKNSSLVKCFDMVKANEADAVVSSGSTGALMMASIHIFGRIKGVLRPALAAVLPNGKKGVLIVDTGANANCKPANLLQFAIMGSIYAEKVMKIQNPRIGLLSNGSEEGKGNLLVKSVYEPMKEANFNFYGNVEARDVLSGDVDVVVCDGFSGNVLLKAIEGTGSEIFKSLKTLLKKDIKSKLGALMLKEGLLEFKKIFDYREYGGAPFLGVTDCVLKAHGSSDELSFFKTIKQANEFAMSNVVEEITTQIQNDEAFNNLNKMEEE